MISMPKERHRKDKILSLCFRLILHTEMAYNNNIKILTKSKLGKGKNLIFRVITLLN